MGLVILALCLLFPIFVLSFRRGDRHRHLLYCSMTIAWYFVLEIVYYLYRLAEKCKFNLNDEQLSNSEKFHKMMMIYIFSLLGFSLLVISVVLSRRLLAMANGRNLNRRIAAYIGLH